MQDLAIPWVILRADRARNMQNDSHAPMPCRVIPGRPAHHHSNDVRIAHYRL